MARADVSRLFVLVALAVALGTTTVFYVKALTRLDHIADANSSLSLSDRQIAGGNAIVVDQEAAYEAAALIPRTAPYRFRTGSHLKNATPLTRQYVESWFRYYLMPRRPASDARWIICYGCDLQVGAGFIPLWHDKNRISIWRGP